MTKRRNITGTLGATAVVVAVAAHSVASAAPNPDGGLAFPMANAQQARIGDRALALRLAIGRDYSDARLGSLLRQELELGLPAEAFPRLVSDLILLDVAPSPTRLIEIALEALDAGADLPDDAFERIGGEVLRADEIAKPVEIAQAEPPALGIANLCVDDPLTTFDDRRLMEACCVDDPTTEIDERLFGPDDCPPLTTGAIRDADGAFGDDDDDDDDDDDTDTVQTIIPGTTGTGTGGGYGL